MFNATVSCAQIYKNVKKSIILTEIEKSVLTFFFCQFVYRYYRYYLTLLHEHQRLGVIFISQRRNIFAPTGPPCRIVLVIPPRKTVYIFRELRKYKPPNEQRSNPEIRNRNDDETGRFRVTKLLDENTSWMPRV